MLMIIDKVLTAEQAKTWRDQLEAACWDSGLNSAGSLARHVKLNQQLGEDSALAISLGNEIVRRLGQHPQFLSAALPAKILPPRFNRYAGGGSYGAHVDSSIMSIPGVQQQFRSDISCTLFFSDAEDYEGGELQIETSFGMQTVKLSAGDMVVYPASSLHQVTPVTQGVRLASFFWVQSMIRSDTQRSLLFDLDQSIQALTATAGSENHEILRLTGVYHNLLRQWAEP